MLKLEIEFNLIDVFACSTVQINYINMIQHISLAFQFFEHIFIYIEPKHIPTAK
jgi:hypothetical protein